MKKNILSFVKSIALVVVALSTTALSATLTNEELIKRMDQPFVYFKTMGKYPIMSYCHPGIKELKNVLCGTENIGGSCSLVKKPTDLETLTVLRMMDIFSETSTQVDKKYASREAVISKALEAMFKVLHLMPRESYKGTVLVDELLQGLPMKWVLKNKEELHSLLAYINYKLSQTDQKPVRKSLLALEFSKETELTESEIAELSVYFELAKLDDPEIIKFYATCDANLAFYLDYPAKKYVAESIGESILREIEGDHNDFEFKKMTIKAVKWAFALTAAAIFMDTIKPELTSKITKNLRLAIGLEKPTKS